MESILKNMYGVAVTETTRKLINPKQIEQKTTEIGGTRKSDYGRNMSKEWIDREPKEGQPAGRLWRCREVEVEHRLKRRRDEPRGSAFAWTKYPPLLPWDWAVIKKALTGVG